MKNLLSAFIALLLPLTAGAFPFRHTPRGAGQPAAPASHAQREGSEAEGPAWVDPELVKKKVVVYFRDGRIYEGKLVELTDDFLRLKMGKRTEKIALTEVASVVRKQQRSRALLGVAIAGVAIGAVLLGLFIAATRD